MPFSPPTFAAQVFCTVYQATATPILLVATLGFPYLMLMPADEHNARNLLTLSLFTIGGAIFAYENLKFLDRVNLTPDSGVAQ